MYPVLTNFIKNVVISYIKSTIKSYVISIIYKVGLRLLFWLVKVPAIAELIILGFSAVYFFLTCYYYYKNKYPIYLDSILCYISISLFMLHFAHLDLFIYFQIFTLSSLSLLCYNEHIFNKLHAKYPYLAMAILYTLIIINLVTALFLLYESISALKYLLEWSMIYFNAWWMHVSDTLKRRRNGWSPRGPRPPLGPRPIWVPAGPWKKNEKKRKQRFENMSRNFDPHNRYKCSGGITYADEFGEERKSYTVTEYPQNYYSVDPWFKPVDAPERLELPYDWEKERTGDPEIDQLIDHFNQTKYCYEIKVTYGADKSEGLHILSDHNECRMQLEEHLSNVANGVALGLTHEEARKMFYYSLLCEYRYRAYYGSLQNYIQKHGTSNTGPIKILEKVQFDRQMNWVTRMVKETRKNQ